jgi:DNA-binding HxlR family transcriptional regulator
MKSGFGQFCPVAIACEVVAERWTPIILRELLAGADQFNALHRGIPRISRPLLAKRLRDLEKAGVIATQPLPGGRGYRYRLTESGQELRSVVDALGTWGQRWTARVRRDTLDPRFLMWNMRRRIAVERLPARRVVVEFLFSAVPEALRAHRRFWLVLQPAQVDLCVDDPGYDVDLYVECEIAAMAAVWLGDLALTEAVRARRVRMSGARELVRAFPDWLMLSRFAAVQRPEQPASRA